MTTTPWVPLATRMRPTQLDHFVGQKHLLANDKPLTKAISEGHLHSMIFWGPPGTGKTTLAEIIAQQVTAEMIPVSAVLSGVKDIRAAVTLAQQNATLNKKTIVFVDEVHRFNKAQQDAFLPHVEAGTITLIGATTENPSFQLNHALLSRIRVYVFKPLQQEDLQLLIRQTLLDDTNGLGEYHIQLNEQHITRLIQHADGDARRCLNMLELIADLVEPNNSEQRVVNDTLLNNILSESYRHFDQGGDVFYEQISALHKSVRGSDPDAAVYWLQRMLDGGCDPVYLARRITRIASEDIGNADPRALTIALDAWQAYERLGSPEGELVLAQAVIYLACAAKSNAVYLAAKQASQDVEQHGSLEVPAHLRNAPTSLMKNLGYGKDYQYAHDHDDGFVPGETYLPDAIKGKHYYQPVERGLEIKIKQKLVHLQQLNQDVKE